MKEERKAAPRVRTDPYAVALELLLPIGRFSGHEILFDKGVRFGFGYLLDLAPDLLRQVEVARHQDVLQLGQAPHPEDDRRNPPVMEQPGKGQMQRIQAAVVGDLQDLLGNRQVLSLQKRDPSTWIRL